MEGLICPWLGCHSASRSSPVVSDHGWPGKVRIISYTHDYFTWTAVKGIKPSLGGQIEL